MSDPLVGSSPALDRLRELAIEAARQNHFTGFVYDEDGATRHEFNGDVDHGFKTCPHHDCTLVRELVPVPPQPTDQPEDARGRFVLNSYGRQCFDLGVQSVVPPTPSGAQPPIDERVLLDLNTRIFYAETGLRALIESAQLYRQKAMVAAPAPSAPQPAIDLLRRLRGWDMFNPPWNCADGAFWAAEIDKVLAAASGLSPSAET